MNAIDILEKRIKALELVILPNEPETVKNLAITDLLLQTQTMISSALSCREAITSILSHMNTINAYLDPTNGENDIEVETKRIYLLELYPELKELVHSIGTFESLIPYTDPTNLLRVNDLSVKLEELAVANINIYEDNKIITKKVLESLQVYSDITSCIKLLFGQMDKAITDLEAALQVQFSSEE